MEGEIVVPGFRFYPTEEELISFYLHHKLHATLDLDRVIPVVDIYKHEPWELPLVAGGKKETVSEEQWFFFTAQQEREARGGKPNRTTPTGYWKATGSLGWVYSISSSSSRGSSSSSNSNVIGAKKTMVFYKGRAPFGSKTPWKMNEYKAVAAVQPHNDQILDASSTTPKLRHEMSVCRVYITSAGSSRAFDRRPLSDTDTITALLPPLPLHHQQQLLQSPVADDHQGSSGNTIANNINNDEEHGDNGELIITNGLPPLPPHDHHHQPQQLQSAAAADDHQGSSGNTIATNINNDEEEDTDGDELMITNGLQPFWEWERFN